MVNDEHFGRPRTRKGERSAFPQARVVAVAECGTHAMIDAVIGAYTDSENTVSAELLGRLEPGMLCLADRGFCSYTAWQAASATGADLLWRVMAALKLKSIQDLDDGSYVAEVFDSKADRRREHPTRVRVIEYTIEDGRAETGPYRLVITLLDTARPQQPSWPQPMPNVGRSSLLLTSSKPTSADPGQCCARSRPSWSSRRFGAACVAATRSGR